MRKALREALVAAVESISDLTTVESWRVDDWEAGDLPAASVNFGDSDIEPVPKLAYYGFKHSPLTLKGHIFRYAKLYFTYTYNHNR